MAIIAFWLIANIALLEAEERFAFELDMRPTNIWAMFWIIVGLLRLLLESDRPPSAEGPKRTFRFSFTAVC